MEISVERTLAYNTIKFYLIHVKILHDIVYRKAEYEIIGTREGINPLNPELNPICYLLALLGAHHLLHVSRIRVKLLTFRLLMSYIYIYIYIYIYMEHPFLMFLDHTQ